MRPLRVTLAGVVFLFATAQTPPGFPKRVAVPALQMTGVSVPLATTSATPSFTAKKVAVTALQMTGVDIARDAATPSPFTPKKVAVPALVMTGVN